MGVKFGVKMKTLFLNCLVFILNKYALRLVSFSLPHSPSAPIFNRLKILNIFYLVKLLNILLVHQYLVFEEIVHAYPTHSQSLGLLKLPFVNVNTTTYGLKSLSNHANFSVEFFQNLFPNTCLAELPLNKLKTLDESHLLSKYN